MALHAQLMDEPPSLIERGGAPYELRLKYLVTGLTKSDYTALTDALNTPGIPQPLAVDPNNQNLLVVDRIPSIHQSDPTIAEVLIIYQRRQRVVFQLTGDNFIVTGGTTVQEVDTAFDIFGVQPSVSHTYPSTDPDYPSTTLQHGGIMRVLRPQSTWTFEGVLQHAFPQAISRAYTGYVNSTTWGGDPATTWLCTRVDYELLDIGALPSAKWRFTFEFQYKFDSWDDTIVFIDPRYNIPPPDLVSGVGYKSPQSYPRIDFNEVFAI